MPSHTDTAEHTKPFVYPVTQTRLDVPRPLITQSWSTGGGGGGGGGVGGGGGRGP